MGIAQRHGHLRHVSSDYEAHGVELRDVREDEGPVSVRLLQRLRDLRRLQGPTLRKRCQWARHSVLTDLKRLHSGSRCTNMRIAKCDKTSV